MALVVAGAVAAILALFPPSPAGAASDGLSERARGCLHARAMVRHDFFSHNSPSGRSFATRIRLAGCLAGARSWRVGEVIAARTGRRGTARWIVRAWMHSPGHREQILTRGYRHLGVGVSDGFPGGGRRGATYTIDFGTRG